MSFFILSFYCNEYDESLCFLINRFVRCVHLVNDFVCSGGDDDDYDDELKFLILYQQAKASLCCFVLKMLFSYCSNRLTDCRKTVQELSSVYLTKINKESFNSPSKL